MAAASNVQDLPRDNAARLAIYDVFAEHCNTAPARTITDDELFERVIGRLRVLVPRELHLAGDRAYVDEKVNICIEAGVIAASSDNGRRFLTLTGQRPLIRYPSGEVRQYPPGLELARERLERDNARLRAAQFNVRKIIPSIADRPKAAEFQALLASMREHGFLKQFPVVAYEDGTVVDGVARRQAAAILELDVEYLKDRATANRRDTPLNRVMVAVHSNTGRLAIEVIDSVYDSVAKVTRRSWDETAADLVLTAEWRRSVPAQYYPWFDVKKLPYRDGDDPQVQVTSDNKVMVRSLVQAGGLAAYNIDKQLSSFVALEKARSKYSTGQKAQFAPAEDLITGIEAMLQDRRAAGRTVDPRWDEMRDWLIRTFGHIGR